MFDDITNLETIYNKLNKLEHAVKCKHDEKPPCDFRRTITISSSDEHGQLERHHDLLEVKAVKNTTTLPRIENVSFT